MKYCFLIEIYNVISLIYVVKGNQLGLNIRPLKRDVHAMKINTKGKRGNNSFFFLYSCMELHPNDSFTLMGGDPL